MRGTILAVAITVVSSCASTATRLTPSTSAYADGEPHGDEEGHDLDDQDQGNDDHDHHDHDGYRSADPHPRPDGPPGPAPRVADVLAAAYRAAGLGDRLPGRLALRARIGGLVPWVSVRTGRDTSWRDADPDVGRGTTLEVRATWRLDRLVFDGRELQVVALEAARRRERRRVATHVIRTYFAWKRSGSRSEEAAAELDALTAGWFSEARQRTASEVRTVAAPRAPP